MPLYLTASHSSRIHKPGRAVTGPRRNSSSPFSAALRTKTIQRTKSLGRDGDDDSLATAEQLDATGKTLSAITVSSAHDVMSALEHITATVFCQMPDRAGMNSVRIAQVLNFQKNLPPVVSSAHVHALISASSKVEREIASLLATGAVRKIKVIGRGNDVSGLSEVLISSEKFEKLLKECLPKSDIADDFCQILHQYPKATSVSSSVLAPQTLSALMNAGFLVSSSLSGPASTSLSGASLVGISSISRAASGSVAAVGGDAAFEQLGGVGTARRSNPLTGLSNSGPELYLSVPNLGPYLRLLHAGRTHLLELLGKSNKYREMPLYLLRERWEGAVDSDSRASAARQIRGEHSAVLPGKTKKWKDLNGLSFDWALEECFGAGLVELFETRSVGLGIRALT